MKTTYVCTMCGSDDVYVDAYAALNSDEVLTYDQQFCMSCGQECHTEEIEIEDEEGK